MEKISGVVESKSRKGNSIKVGGEWYSCFNASDLNHVIWKDSVEFMYVQKGQYRNIKGKVEILAGGGGASSSGGGGSRSAGGYSNLGVELGHASNLAMKVMEQMVTVSDIQVGSADYYTQFIEQTEKMYTIMKGIRGKYEAEDAKPKVADKPSVAPASSSAVEEMDEDDLF
jgi:hypothetical protein